MKKKIIVTGSAGYIGSHTILEILESNVYEPVGIDNFSNSHREVYDRIKKISGKSFTSYDVDVSSAEALEEVFRNEKKIYGIIHFAAFKMVGESCENPGKYYYNNIQGLVQLLECSRRYGVEKFIFSSSCSVYGNAEELPVTENTPLKFAQSPYGHTKTIGEEIIRQYARLFRGTEYVILRYFNPVGAHPSAELGEYPIHKPTNLFPVITQTAAGLNHLMVHGNDYPTRDGTCIRDYIHVCDIARAHVLALEYTSPDKNVPEVFNLGSGTGLSVMEIIRAFEKFVSVPLPFTIGPRRTGDVVAIYADNRKAKKELHWECRYGLKEMIVSAWQWQQHLLKKNFSGSLK